MVPYLGDFAEDATVYIMFNTFSSDDPSASVTITNFINTDVHIHKDDGLTQRNNAAGITVSVDFDGITGSHMIKIDTSDDTVAAFWVTGSDYFVRVEGTTVDGATINAVVGHFSIENRFNEVDVTKILGHLLTTTGTQIADAFEKFFDVSSPTGTVNSLPDAVPDAAGGLPVSDAGALDLDAMNTNVSDILDDTGTNGVVLADDAITSAKYDESTAYPLESADTGATAVARTGADGDTLETLSDEIDAVPTASEIQTEMEENGASLLDTIRDNIGTPANIDSGGATIADNLKKIADDNGGATFDTTTDSLVSLRDNELTTIAADVENIDGEAMRGTDSANTTVPDAAGTAAGLHTTTDGKIDAVQGDVTTIAGDVANIDGEAMRGTDNAALASVLGALADAAAAGDPTEADTLMQYAKQLINILVGTAGIGTFPAEAAPANAVSLAEVMRAIHTDVTGIDGDAMRGTDGANTTVPDAAGTAAGLHATTDGKVDAVQGDVTTIAGDVANIDGDAMRGTDGANTTVPDAAGTAAGLHTTTDAAIAGLNDLSSGDVQTVIETNKLDHLVAVADSDDAVDNSLVAKLATSDGDWSGFSAATDSLEAIRDRGDAAWVTGGGGAISDILSVIPLVPNAIDLANTATIRIALGLTNMVDDLPSTVEITPGTLTIDRKAIGGTSWTNVVNAAACSEVAGLIYYDEVFDSGTGYAAGDSIRLTFKSQKITVAANDYEITGTDGWIFHTYIREAMRGTDSANTTVPDAAGTAAGLHSTTDGKIDAVQGDVTTIAADVENIDGEAMRGTDSANTTVPDAAGTAAGLHTTTDGKIDGLNDLSSSDVQSEVTDALNTYDPPTKAEMDTAHALLATPAQVNTQVLGVLNVDTFAEPGQGAPTATTTLAEKIGYLYKAWRNKTTQTADTLTLYNDDGTTAGQAATRADNGTTFTKGEYGTGA